VYIPAHFDEAELSVVLELIEANPLASIVTHRPEGLDANPVPLLLESRAPGALTLIGHVSRKNHLGTDATPGEAVLVLFRGAQGYVSPNWYPGKARDENQVPTWNYQVVNLRGVLEIVDDEKFVRGVVARLVTKNEASQPKPWKMTDSDPAYIDQNLTQIVGLRITVTDVKAKFKLSQNRSHEDWLGAAQGLGSAGNSALESAMLDAYHRNKD
jgi:transcriptional regulator